MNAISAPPCGPDPELTSLRVLYCSAYGRSGGKFRPGLRLLSAARSAHRCLRGYDTRDLVAQMVSLRHFNCSTLIVFVFSRGRGEGARLLPSLRSRLNTHRALVFALVRACRWFTLTPPSPTGASKLAAVKRLCQPLANEDFSYILPITPQYAAETSVVAETRACGSGRA